MKKCSKCKVEKDQSEFRLYNKKKPLGCRKTICIPCECEERARHTRDKRRKSEEDLKKLRQHKNEENKKKDKLKHREACRKSKENNRETYRIRALTTYYILKGDIYKPNFCSICLKKEESHRLIFALPENDVSQIYWCCSLCYPEEKKRLNENR